MPTLVGISERRPHPALSLLIPFTLLLTLCGCATRAVWDWQASAVAVVGTRSSEKGKIDRVYLHITGVSGHRDGYYEVAVPDAWKHESSWQFVDDVPDANVALEYRFVSDVVQRYGNDSLVRLDDSAVHDVSTPTRSPPEVDRYGYQRHKSEDQHYSCDIYGWHEAKERWVRIGAIEIGRNTQSAGLRKTGAILATPVTLAADIVSVPFVLGYTLLWAARAHQIESEELEKAQRAQALDAQKALDFGAAQTNGIVAIDVARGSSVSRPLGAVIEDAAGISDALPGVIKGGVIVVADVPPGQYRLRRVTTERERIDRTTSTDSWVIADSLSHATFDVSAGTATYVGRLHAEMVRVEPLTIRKQCEIEINAEHELEVWNGLRVHVANTPWAAVIDRRLAALRGAR